MPRKIFKRPRLVLSLWSLALCALAALLVGLNVAMLQYAQIERERDHRVWLARANEALLAGNYTAARDAIIMAQHLAPGHPEPLLTEGHLHYKLKKWELAVQAYQLAMRYGSLDPGIRQNTVWACIELKQYRKAAQLGRHYMEEHIAGPQLPRIVAEAHYRMGNYKGAIPYLKLALQYEPGDLYLLDKLERCHRHAGQTEEAELLRTEVEALQSEMSAFGAAQE